MVLSTSERTGILSDEPVVSIIIPARNEEANLGPCLRSLIDQAGIPFEIIVVDDGSTDATRAVAQSHMGVRVIPAGLLPEGWCGKSHAAWVGASNARGRWFLFTDADTVHQPGSLVRSVAEAQQKEASLLSYSPGQIVRTIGERLVMPLVFAELANTYKPREVSNQSSLTAAANGQYLMITREAYQAIGGHAAVAGDILEDVALARAAKKTGRRIQFRYGDDVVRARMYRSFLEMCRGWTKNLALLFPSPVKLAMLRSLEFLFSVGGLTTAVVALAVGAKLVALIAAVIAVST